MHYKISELELVKNRTGTVGKMYDMSPEYHSFYWDGSIFVYNNETPERLFVPRVYTEPAISTISLLVGSFDFHIITYETEFGYGCGIYMYEN